MDGYAWVDPSGFVIQLSDGTDGITELQGRNGARMPTVSRTRGARAGQPGTRLLQVEHEFRTFELPVFVEAATPALFEALVDEVVQRFDPKRGDGQLRHLRVDGTTRTLDCRCVEGFASLDVDYAYPGQSRTLLVFEADDPYWKGEFHAQTWRLGGAQPFLPFVLDGWAFASDAVLGEVSFDVVSDVPVQPVWTIVGPGTAIELTNVTTGEVLAWDGTLAAGQTLVVDTRAGAKTVLQNGVSAFESLTAFEFWPLQPGSNLIDVQMADASNGSRVSVDWQDLHLSA